jgi:hypothetical protein
MQAGVQFGVQEFGGRAATVSTVTRLRNVTNRNRERRLARKPPGPLN